MLPAGQQIWGTFPGLTFGQITAVPAQVPLARHTSFVVHGLPSLHVWPVLMGFGGHVAELPVQVACVSHWVGVGPHTKVAGLN